MCLVNLISPVHLTTWQAHFAASIRKKKKYLFDLVIVIDTINILIRIAFRIFFISGILFINYVIRIL